MARIIGLDMVGDRLFAVELENGGSDRFVDAMVAWGDDDAIQARIQAHFDAGASHVCIQPLHPVGERRPDLDALAAFAP